MAEHNLQQLMMLAAKARTEADEAVLDNVRERCLRAEAAWLDMAARAQRSADLRGRQAEEKAARPAYPYLRRNAVALAGVDDVPVCIED